MEKKVLEQKKPISEAEMERVTLNTKEQLNAQPKENVRIPVDADIKMKLKGDTSHKDWPFTTVQINGYTYQIKHGEKVAVPQSVYEVLEQAGRI